jgi:hypothetical protein
LRAGLLSDPKVIAVLNKRFVSTSIIIDDLEKRAKSGDAFAKQVESQWEYPLEMMFLTSARKLVSKLHSFKDFAGTHPDVAALHKEPEGLRADSHTDVFLKHVAAHFGRE